MVFGGIGQAGLHSGCRLRGTYAQLSWSRCELVSRVILGSHRLSPSHWLESANHPPLTPGDETGENWRAWEPGGCCPDLCENGGVLSVVSPEPAAHAAGTGLSGARQFIVRIWLVRTELCPGCSLRVIFIRKFYSESSIILWEFFAQRETSLLNEMIINTWIEWSLFTGRKPEWTRTAKKVTGRF